MLALYVYITFTCVLGKQAPRVKYPTKQPKASARILTAEENLQLIAEKERKKKLEEEKQRKRMKREERRLQAEEEKKRKSMLREQRWLAREEKAQQSTRHGDCSTVKGNPWMRGDRKSVV